jgi:hypothetical protein
VGMDYEKKIPPFGIGASEIIDLNNTIALFRVVFNRLGKFFFSFDNHVIIFEITHP